MGLVLNEEHLENMGLAAFRVGDHLWECLPLVMVNTNQELHPSGIDKSTTLGVYGYFCIFARGTVELSYLSSMAKIAATC